MSPTNATSDRVILPAEFFARHALTVARQLLGKYVVLRRDGAIRRRGISNP